MIFSIVTAEKKSVYIAWTCFCYVYVEFQISEYMKRFGIK